MKEENGTERWQQNSSSNGHHMFKAVSRLAALVHLGGMPVGNAAGPLVLWLMESDPDLVFQERKERGW